MKFEWDTVKARSNLAKYGIAFDVAERVCDDPLHVIVHDRVEQGGDRWHAVGVVGRS